MAKILKSLNLCIGETKNNLRVFSNLLEDLCNQEKQWSSDNPNCDKIPWESESEAYKDESKWRGILKSKGIYIFGTNEGIIRYVGKAENQCIHKRLRGRYVGGNLGGKSQCQIAKSITAELNNNNNNNNEMEEYKKNYVNDYEKVVEKYKLKCLDQKVSKQRLIGALDFTYHGIDNIWFTALPINDTDLIASIESMFILAAKEHKMNKSVKLRLLNDKN